MAAHAAMDAMPHGEGARILLRRNPHAERAQFGLDVHAATVHHRSRRNASIPIGRSAWSSPAIQ